jgi:hypothetical protein
MIFYLVDNVESSGEPLNFFHQFQRPSLVSAHHFAKKVATEDQPMTSQSALKQSIYQVCCPPSLNRGEDKSGPAEWAIVRFPTVALR